MGDDVVQLAGDPRPLLGDRGLLALAPRRARRISRARVAERQSRTRAGAAAAPQPSRPLSCPSRVERETGVRATIATQRRECAATSVTPATPCADHGSERPVSGVHAPIISVASVTTSATGDRPRGAPDERRAWRAGCTTTAEPKGRPWLPNGRVHQPPEHRPARRARAPEISAPVAAAPSAAAAASRLMAALSAVPQRADARRPLARRDDRARAAPYLRWYGDRGRRAVTSATARRSRSTTCRSPSARPRDRLRRAQRRGQVHDDAA